MTKRPLRVVHCPVNTAGVPWANVQALRRRGVDASLVVFNRYELHPEADRSLELHGGLLRRQAAQWKALAELIPRTDLFHFTFGLTLVPQSLQFPLLRAFGKASVMHYLGSDIRGKSPAELAYGKKAGAEIVGSYDAIRWVPDAAMIPPGVDLNAIAPVAPSGRKRPVVVHAPSSRRRKGTDHVLAACAELDVELRIVEGLHHREALEHYRDADIVVDQLNAGWYGLFAIECMALGKPVVTFLHDEAVRRTEEAYDVRVPIVNATADTLRERLDELVALGAEGREEVGRASRSYVEQVHDLERVTDRLVDLYAAVLEPSRVRGAVAIPTAPPAEAGPALPLGDTDLDGSVPARVAAPRDARAEPVGLGSQLRRLGRHSAIYGIGGLVSRVIAVLLLPVYTRYLSPTDYGQIETLLALTTVMGLVLRAGITSAFFRFYFDETDDDGRRRVLRTSFWFTMGGATLGLALLLVLAEPVSSLLFGTGDAADLVRAAGVALWATVNYEQLTALFRVEERSVAFVCASLANIFLTIGLTLLLVVVYEQGPLGVIVGNLSGTLIVYLSLLGYRREQLGLEFDRGLLREMNRFGVPLVPTALFLWVTNFSDRFFLVKLADVAEAGVYSVGVRIASAMVLLLTAFRTAWPAFAYSIRDEDEARQTYAYVLTYLTVVTAWVALALSLLAPWLVDLLADDAFGEAADVVGPLAFSTVAYAAYIVVAIGVGRARRTQFNWVVTGIAALVNVALNLALIPAYGMIGAAIATVAAYATMAVGMAWWAQRIYPVPYQWRRVGTAALAAVGLAALGALLDAGLVVGAALDPRLPARPAPLRVHEPGRAAAAPRARAALARDCLLGQRAPALGQRERFGVADDEPAPLRAAHDAAREVAVPAEVLAEVRDPALHRRLGAALVVREMDRQHRLGELEPLPGAPPGSRDEPAPRGERPGERERRSAARGDAPGDRGVEREGEPVAGERGGRADRAGEHDEPAQPVRQQVGGRGRGDHQRDDEDRADGVEGADGRHGDERHQDVLEHDGREPERERERGIEGRELQLLPEDRDHGRVEDEDEAHDEERGGPEVPAPGLEPVERRERELAEEHGVGVEVHAVRVAGDDDHARGRRARGRRGRSRRPPSRAGSS